MSRFAFAVAALSVFSLGCPSPQEICREGVDQVCERVFECTPPAAQDATFQAGFGTSIEQCKELLYANPLRPQRAQGIACADVDDDQKLCTNINEPNATDFKLDKASECKETRADMSCQDYMAQLRDPALQPPECPERCE